jgi:hypothetical protein
MKQVTSQMAENPVTIEKLREIQSDARVITEPHYHEYHRITSERGFIKITIPKRHRA